MKSSTNTIEDLKFNEIEKRVYIKTGDKITIGGELISNELLDVLHEQAKYLQQSQIYDIITCTLANTAKNSALIHSNNFEDVMLAKMLYKWCRTFEKMIEELSNL